jgi:hypothetical protein
LDEKRTVDADLVDKIIETICGIANIGPDVTGAVFIGIADMKSDRDRIVELDKIVAAEISSRYVVGVDREAAVLNVSVEKYKRDIVDRSRTLWDANLRGAGGAVGTVEGRGREQDTCSGIVAGGDGRPQYVACRGAHLGIHLVVSVLKERMLATNQGVWLRELSAV